MHIVVGAKQLYQGDGGRVVTMGAERRHYRPCGVVLNPEL